MILNSLISTKHNWKTNRSKICPLDLCYTLAKSEIFLVENLLKSTVRKASGAKIIT